MSKEEFWVCVVLNIIAFAILNIWFLWGWALLFSIVLIWGGFLIIDSAGSFWD